LELVDGRVIALWFGDLEYRHVAPAAVRERMEGLLARGEVCDPLVGHFEYCLDVPLGRSEAFRMVLRSWAERSLRARFVLNRAVSVHRGRFGGMPGSLATGLPSRFLYAGAGFDGLLGKLEREGSVVADDLNEREQAALARWVYRGVAVEEVELGGEQRGSVAPCWRSLLATPAGAREVLRGEALWCGGEEDRLVPVFGALEEGFGVFRVQELERASKALVLCNCYVPVDEYASLARRLKRLQVDWVAVMCFPGYSVLVRGVGNSDGYCLQCSLRALHGGAYSRCCDVQGFVFERDVQVARGHLSGLHIESVAMTVAGAMVGLLPEDVVVVRSWFEGRGARVEAFRRGMHCEVCEEARPVLERVESVEEEEEGWCDEEELLSLVGLFGGVCAPVREERFCWDSEGEWAFVAVGSPIRRAVSAYSLFSNRGSSSGKGLSFRQARLGAIAEAVERAAAHWSYHGWRCVLRAECTLAKGVGVVSPRVLSCFLDGQFEEREALNAMGYVHCTVPVRYGMEDEERPIWWIAAERVGREERVYVPASYVLWGVPREVDVGEGDGCPYYCGCGSSGLAAARDIGTARLKAVLEVVERDAVALWWYRACRRATVQVDGCGHWWLGQAVRRFADAGRELKLVDVSTFAQLPVVVAVSSLMEADREGSFDVVLSSGCGFSYEEAGIRAVGENLQLLDPRGRSAFRGEGRLADIRAWKARCAAPFAGLRFGAAGDIEEMEGRVAPLGDELGEGRLERVVRLLEGEGLECAFVDLGVKRLGLAVARAVVPGLCHPWHHLGHVRLREEGVLSRVGVGDAGVLERDSIPVFF